MFVVGDRSNFCRILNQGVFYRVNMFEIKNVEENLLYLRNNIELFVQLLNAQIYINFVRRLYSKPIVSITLEKIKQNYSNKS